MEKINNLKWIRTGIICGYLTVIVYPLMMIFDLPVQLTLTLAVSFGILLLVASIGIYHFIKMNKKTVSAQLGVLFNIIAASIVVLMLTVQLGLSSEGKNAGQDIQKKLRSMCSRMPI
jgi:zinc transporter ZupT